MLAVTIIRNILYEDSCVTERCCCCPRDDALLGGLVMTIAMVAFAIGRRFFVMRMPK